MFREIVVDRNAHFCTSVISIQVDKMYGRRRYSRRYARGRRYGYRRRRYY